MSTYQPVGYSSIWHLASITEKDDIEGIFLNPQPAKKSPLTQDDREELNFSDERTFLCYVETAPREVYNSVMRLQKHRVVVDKQNCKLKRKYIKYKKTNETYVLDNTQLKSENHDLENRLADLEKQLKDARLNKHSSLPPPLFSASPPLSASASDDSDSKSKHSHRSYQSQKTKLTKLPDPLMLTDDNTTRFDIDVWESKMAKKLATNVDHYNTKTLHIAYVDSHVDGNTYKH